ncbi:MAG: hypothetical protein ABR874_19210 [Candidatus Sulfotelmatobacter sp.]
MVTDEGQHWTVSPGFLRKIEAPQASEAANVFTIDSAKSSSRK